MRIIDSHVHACPDNLAEKNKRIILDSSGITPAYDGSISQLSDMMRKSRISLAVVNNIVLKPELMRKANDWTARVVSSDRMFVGMGWIIPGLSESVSEVERCKNELGFRAVKIHHSHFKVLPSDPKNDKIYEKIVECGLPVLFHCGKNPYSNKSSAQYSQVENFIPVLESFQDMKIILGHLAGFQDDASKAQEILTTFDYLLADTAIDLSRSDIDLSSLVSAFGASKLIFGSDYPIQDGGKILEWMKGSLTPEDFESICSKSPEILFSL